LLKNTICLAAVLGALTIGKLSADPIFYTFVQGGVGASTGTLETFDAASPGTPTTIGNLGVLADFGGLAYDSNNNTLYLVDGFGDDITTTHSSLYSVNTTTGLATLIGSTGLADVTGLTYDSANNTLYAAQDVGGAPLVSLNITTGAATAIGTGIAADNLAYDSTNGVLYGWLDCLGCSSLYSINPSTGAQTLLSNTGLDSNDSGLVYDPASNLLWDLDVRGRLTTIDPTAFNQTFVGTFSGGESSGLALVPNSTVPEPAAFLLLGSGLTLLAYRKRRTR
jgi:hypothetical protein